jgi:nitric oxide reductase activation protein
MDAKTVGYADVARMIESLQESAQSDLDTELQYSVRYFAGAHLDDAELEECIKNHDFAKALRLARREQ